MRIAMIHTPFWARAGGERQILRLAIELQKIGHEVKIFTSALNKESYPDFLKEVTVDIVPHPLAGKLPPRLLPGAAQPIIDRRILKEAEETPRLREWMRRIVGRQFYTSELLSMLKLGRKIPREFDLINNHNFPTEWAAFFAKKRLKAPVVWMCNEPPYWFFNPEFEKGLRRINWPLFEVLDKVAVSYIEEIVVLSRIAAGYVKKAYNRSARVVRTGVDTELLHNASGESVRKKHSLENDFVLLQAGSLDPVKRQVDTVKALYYLSKKYDCVKLILDGPGRREELIMLSEKLGIKDKVLFLHSKSDAELVKVYAACDVFVYPSSKSTWGMGLTEAMAAAKPVIVSKLAGASEIVQTGVNGIVVDYEKPEDIAKQAETLMNNPKLCKKLGENAYKYVKNNLSWENYAKNMESIFEQTISNFKKNL
jgi:glycosyltransferase involved in cell wall biosynthesis